MFVLAVVILAVLLSAMFMFGKLDSTQRDTSESLHFQQDVFDRDVSTYFESLASESIGLSRYVTDFIEKDLGISGDSFDRVTNNSQQIERLQTALIEPLAQRLRQQSCSGIFVMLNATVNSSIEEAGSSRTGLYLQQNRYLSSDDNILLYRGISNVGKSNGIMPHRKWRLEFQTDIVPGYDRIIANAGLPLDKAYTITDRFQLPGTSDNVVLMAIPIVGSDGTCYGICGYEVSEDFFAARSVQPSNEERLTCILATVEDGCINASSGLSCGGDKNFMPPPSGSLYVRFDQDGLLRLSGDSESYIGVVKPMTLTPNNSNLVIASMIPKADYDRAVLENALQTVVLWMLLLFFAGACCLFFSRRFLSPILKALDKVKHKDWNTDPAQSHEINDLFSFLAEQDRLHEEEKKIIQDEYDVAKAAYDQAHQNYLKAKEELEHSELELHRLAYSRKTEIDPYDYQNFLEGLERLTPKEKEALGYYIEGKTVQEVIQIMGIKETTLRYHNRNIYSKLGVSSLKQLLRYAAVMKQDQEQRPPSE